MKDEALDDARIAELAALIGLCPLLPLPFADVWMGRRLQGALYRFVARQRGLDLSEDCVGVLTRDDDSLLKRMLVKLFWWPIRKLVKTVLYFLTVKECVDWAAESLVRAQMVALAVDRGALPERAEQVRQVMDEVCQTEGVSPIERWLKREALPPASSWPRGEGMLVARARGLQRRGGGAILIDAFTVRLDSLLLGAPPSEVLDAPVPARLREPVGS